MLNKIVTNKKVRPFMVLLIMGAFLFTNVQAFQQAPLENFSNQSLKSGSIERSSSITNSEQGINPEAEALLDVTISGRVTDSSTGESLVGVTVFIEGTQIGTTTDMDGFYTLDVPEDALTITFSYVGYISQSVQIADETEINIELQADIARLDDLVVVGYGVQRRSEITGSVGIVRADELAPASFNALQGLRGKVAGVNIFTNSGAPTGSNRVIIRGTGSINASTDPLYIVDGVAMDDGINFLNPNDIESIEVLKDASATAIYGSRGANGVILVTTQRGGSQERVSVGYNTNLSVGKIERENGRHECRRVYGSTANRVAKCSFI